MKINQNTRVSALIKFNPEVINRLADLNSNFSKLKNPLLRKVLASRVSIADAAKIGKVAVTDFIASIEDLGFEIEGESKYTNGNNQEVNNNKIDFKSLKLTNLDVRPILKDGIDPFKTIIDSLKKLKEKEALCVINTFEPIPLINKLKKEGYVIQVERDEEGNVYTYFAKGIGTISKIEEKEELLPDDNNFELKLSELKENFKIIDVRDMEMPMPMVTILSELEKMPKDQALFVHHKKLPQFLIPELENRGFAMLSKKINEENMDLLIFKK